MEYSSYRRMTPRENTFTQMTYNKSPSTTVGGSAPTRKGYGQASPLTVHDPNGEQTTKRPYTPRSIADLGDDVRPTTANKYHNAESDPAALSDWPKTGVRKVEPVVHREAHRGLRMVHNSNVDANNRHLNVVGSNTIHVDDTKGLDRPLSGIKCRPQSHREGGWMNRQFEESDRPHTTTAMELATRLNPEGHNDNPEVQRRLEEEHDRDHTLNKLQRVRITVCDHVMNRAGGPSRFYCHLVRGQIGANPQTPRYTPQGHQYPREERHLTIESFKEQVHSLTGEDVQTWELAYLLYGREAVETRSYPDVINYKDFIDVFGKVPESHLLASHKI